MKTNSTRALTLFLALFIFQITLAQEKTISGTVTDDNNLPLPGVNVTIKNTSTGTQTDFNGNYSINANRGVTLSFSYVGFETKEVAVKDQITLDIQLSISASQLEEVVVNALGITVKRSDVTASISTVGGDLVSDSGESGLIQGLSAKVAGVNITNTSGDPGASAYIQIRGQSSITRSLQPLFVIDGIPLNNDEIGNTTAGTAQQSRVNDINPNDIRSVKILKGASASALWGSRAANGVILITTKSGSKNAAGKIDVTVFSNISFDQVLRKLPLQDTFGKGNDGTWSGGSGSGSWGDRISSRAGGNDIYDRSGEYFESISGTTIYPISVKNSRDKLNERNFDAVFKTGTYLENGVGLTGGNERGTFYLSLGKLDQEGMIRQSDYVRYNARFNASLTISDKLNFKGNFAYTNTNSNRIQTGSNLSGLLLGLYRTPADFDITDYTGTHYDENGVPYNNSHRAYRRQTGTYADNRNPRYNNPLWTINRQKNPSEVDRYIASGQVQYTMNDWINFVGIGGIDNYSDFRSSLFPINANQNNGGGYYNQRTINYSSYYTTLYGQLYKEIATDLNLEFTLGYNFTQRKTNETAAEYKNFILDTDQITFANAVAEDVLVISDPDLLSGVGLTNIRTSAAFAQANFDYKSMLYLNLTGRAENASSFGGDKVFFYPSVGLGFAFTELGSLSNNDILSYGKLRLSYGQTGQEPAAYATETYFASAKYTEGYGPAYDASGYTGSIVRSVILGNKDLEPEIKTEYEVGIDLKFLKNRVNLTANLYKNETDGALFESAVPPTSGYSSQYGNYGSIENTGIEIELGVDILNTTNLTWSINGTWNSYKNEVTSIDGAESLFLAGFTGASSRAVEGEPLGTLWGVSYARNDAGQLILDSNGFPTVSPQEGILGDPNPDWRGSIGTTVKYRGFTLSGLF